MKGTVPNPGQAREAMVDDNASGSCAEILGTAAPLTHVLG